MYVLIYNVNYVNKKINIATVIAKAEIHFSKLVGNLNLKIGAKFKFKN
jgi:hypothetical protein